MKEARHRRTFVIPWLVSGKVSSGVYQVVGNGCDRRRDSLWGKGGVFYLRLYSGYLTVDILNIHQTLNLDMVHFALWHCCFAVAKSCHVQLFEIPQTTAYQASLSLTISQNCPSYLHWMGEAIQPSHRLLPSSPSAFNLCQHQGLPMSQFFASGGQSIGASASASVPPKSIQSWFPLRLTGLIFLLSKGFSRVFSSTTIQKHQFFGTLSFYCPALTTIHDHWKDHILDYMDVCQQSDTFALWHYASIRKN